MRTCCSGGVLIRIVDRSVRSLTFCTLTAAKNELEAYIIKMKDVVEGGDEKVEKVGDVLSFFCLYMRLARACGGLCS